MHMGYGKYFHMGNQVLYPHMHNFAYRDRRMHMGIPVCKWTGIAKKFAYGDPRTHNEVVRIRGLTYKPCHYAMVEAEKPFNLHHTSVSFICKVIEHLHLLWMGIWLHTHTALLQEACLLEEFGLAVFVLVSAGSVAAKVEHSGGVETSCPVKLKTCGFETTKTTSAS